jgi:hypothetical protein
LLSQRSLNYFQQWALMYWVYLNRRTQMEDRQIELETQTFNLFPERWSQLYQDKTLAAIALAAGEEVEAPVTDLDALDKWYEEMVATGGKQFASGKSGRDEWGDWQ